MAVFILKIMDFNSLKHYFLLKRLQVSQIESLIYL